MWEQSRALFLLPLVSNLLAVSAMHLTKEENLELAFKNEAGNQISLFELFPSSALYAVIL